MKTIVTAFVVGLGLFASSLRAQEAPKKPGSEHQKLQVFTGKWRFVEVSSPNPFGPVGKVTVDSECRMILDGFFLEERATGVGPDGPVSWLWLLGWDSDKSRYQGAFFDNSGYFNKPWKNDAETRTVSGNTWTGTWVTTEKDGRTYQCRSVTTFAPDLKSTQYEFTYSEDGKIWKTWFKGNGTKVGELNDLPRPAAAGNLRVLPQ